MRGEPAREQRLELGRKNQASGHLRIEQRLDAHVVARQHQPLEPRSSSRIVDGHGEHPTQPEHEVVSVSLVQAQDDLRVGARPETDTVGLEPRAFCGEVVNLAVVHDADETIVGDHRLVSGRSEVEHGEACHPQRCRFAGP
jgi:hypothetical protein